MRRRMISVRVVVAALFMALPGATGAGTSNNGTPAPGWPRSVTDAVGRQVSIPAPPQRIIPLFASNAELVASLGLVSRIAGVEAYTRYPPELTRKPQVGGRLGFSVDAIAALHPDLVILTPARQAMHQLLDPMSRINVPVIVLLARDVPEVLSNLRLVGRVTGEEAIAAATTDALQARLDRVAMEVPAKRPSVIMITGQLGNGMALIARADTYTGDAIIRAGGRHALPRTVVAHVSPEAIVAADPDVLLFAGRQDDLDALVARPGWRLLRAAREGRAYVVPRAEFLIPGPRTIDGIEKLARLLRKDMK